jgi:hypothetical protein
MIVLREEFFDDIERLLAVVGGVVWIVNGMRRDKMMRNKGELAGVWLCNTDAELFVYLSCIGRNYLCVEMLREFYSNIGLTKLVLPTAVGPATTINFFVFTLTQK